MSVTARPGTILLPALLSPAARHLRFVASLQTAKDSSHPVDFRAPVTGGSARKPASLLKPVLQRAKIEENPALPLLENQLKISS
jgi:hypothetical protein